MHAAPILDAIRACLPPGQSRYHLHEPRFAGNEAAYVQDCITTTMVSSVGAYVDRFETMLAEYCGVARAVAMVNGTAALHLALLAAGVQPGDEVLVPALTFVATANAVRHCGATPHFVDSERATLGVDPFRLAVYLEHIACKRAGVLVNKQTGRPIRAVVPVHVFGIPCRTELLTRLCRDYGLVMVEDAAEALGSFRHGVHVGGAGLCATLSFNGNKLATTGGGGAILTNDEALADRVKHLSTTAKTPHPWRYDHDAVGYNYRLPNLNAAMGVAQLEQLDDILAAKRRLADAYDAAFTDVPGVEFVREPAHSRSNCWLNAVLIEADDVDVMRTARDALLAAAHAQGLMLRPAWTLLAKLPMFAQCPSMGLAMATYLEAGLVNLPSGPALAPPSS